MSRVCYSWNSNDIFNQPYTILRNLSHLNQNRNRLTSIKVPSDNIKNIYVTILVMLRNALQLFPRGRFLFYYSSTNSYSNSSKNIVSKPQVHSIISRTKLNEFLKKKQIIKSRSKICAKRYNFMAKVRSNDWLFCDVVFHTCIH